MKFLFLVSDFVFLNGSFLLAIIIRFQTVDFPFQENYLKLLLLGNILWILLIGVFNTHRVFRFEPLEKNLIRTLKMIFSHFTLLFLMTYLIDFRDTSRLVLLYYFGIVLVLSVSFKITVLQVLKYLRRRGVNHRVVAIVGFNQNATNLHDLLTEDVSYGYRVMGYFTDEASDLTSQARVLGKLDDVHEELDKGAIEELYIAVTTTNASRVKKIIRHCDRKGVRVKIIPNFQKYTSSHSVEINYYTTVPVLSMRSEPLSKLPNKILKRGFDIVFSIFVLVGLLSWMFPIVALLVIMDSKGPVIFRQKRSGIDRKVFDCFKFRTMVDNDDSDIVGTQKNDARITKVGKFLRKSRIDELPQFYNVLIGNMSVVGPRPHMLIHTETYSELINEFMVRHYVKPGITGWAQTMGTLDADRKLKEMKEKVKNDIWYIENWSFLLDLKIIINTTINIFRDDPNAI